MRDRKRHWRTAPAYSDATSHGWFCRRSQPRLPALISIADVLQIRTIVFALTGAILVSACSSAKLVRPAAPPHGVAIIPGDSGRVIFVDSSGQVAARLPLAIRAALGSAASSHALYLGALLPDGQRELLAIDLSTAAVIWREPLSGQVGRRIISGIEVWAPDVMMLSPTGRTLTLSFARLGGHGGIASLDVATRSVARFAPLVPHGGLARISAGGVFANGAIVVAGARDSSTRASTIYFLTPDDLTVTDSIAPDAFELGTETLQQVVPSRDGGVLFLNMPRRLARFDLQSRTVTASVPKPAEGAIYLSNGDGDLVLPDAGQGPDDPGSGRVYVFDPATLRPRGSIMLPQSSGGGPRLSIAAAAGERPEQLYVTTGTARIGPTYPTDPSALVELDLRALSVKRLIPLGDWAVGRPFVY